jgi:hypothetical protein
VKRDFGIDQNVAWDLYELLIYEAGSFFAPHRDSEKKWTACSPPWSFVCRRGTRAARS